MTKEEEELYEERGEARDWFFSTGGTKLTFIINERGEKVKVKKGKKSRSIPVRFQEKRIPPCSW